VTALDLRAEARRHMPRIDADASLNESGRATWLARMINEHTSSRVFEGLAEQLRRARLDAALADEAVRFAGEERRHGVLCGAVVEALGGEAAASFPEPEPFLFHEDAAPLEGVLRNVLSIGCLSETVAVALIGAEREEMPGGELRDLLTGIWAEEIGHARFGWRLFGACAPALDVGARRRLTAYLRVAFAHLEEHELAHLPLSSCPPPSGVSLGLCSGQDARVLFQETVEQVIVPRLDSLGLWASAAWKARRAQAPLQASSAPA
jgi:hypothetical protein